MGVIKYKGDIYRKVGVNNKRSFVRDVGKYFEDKAYAYIVRDLRTQAQLAEASASSVAFVKGAALNKSEMSNIRHNIKVIVACAKSTVIDGPLLALAASEASQSATDLKKAKGNEVAETKLAALIRVLEKIKRLAKVLS